MSALCLVALLLSKPNHNESVALSNMPSRAQFFSTGLVPVHSSTLPKVEECSICTCEYSDAVKISSCGHIFDKACIAKWLNMDAKNTCPLCKCNLFDLSADEYRGPTYNLHIQVREALRASRIAERDALNLIETHGVNIEIISTSMFQRAAAHANHYLADSVRPRPGSLILPPREQAYVNIDGAALISCDAIAAGFLAISNLIPALAAAQGRAYNEQQKLDWELTMTYVWQELRKRNVQRIDVLDFAHVFDTAARAALGRHYSDIDTMEVIFTYAVDGPRNLQREDFHLVLHYLAVLCWTAHCENEAHEKKKAEAEAARRIARRKGQLVTRDCVVM